MKRQPDSQCWLSENDVTDLIEEHLLFYGAEEKAILIFCKIICFVPILEFPCEAMATVAALRIYVLSILQ